MEKIKTEIKWAFIFVLATLLWMILEKLSGLHDQHIDKQMYLTMLFMIPAIWIYVLALKDKKRNDYQGAMSYKQGFISGLIITVIVTLLSPLTQWITSTLITPHYFENVIAYSLKTGYYKSLAEAQAYFNLKNYMIQSVASAFVLGIITSAIVAFFIRTKNN
ncbi:hypothetical protein D9M68_513660 [compost metagenome]